MSLLTMIQDVAEGLGLDSPSSVISNTDTSVVTLLRLAQREGRALQRRYDWQVLETEQTFTTTATTNQGALSTIVSAGDLDKILNDTLWDRTGNRPVYGSLSKQRYSTLEAVDTTGPIPEFHLRGGNLLTIPAPATGETWAFLYKSKFWCQSSGGTGQTAWAADTDTGILDEGLMALGIEWRYLKSKGFDYSEEFVEYERQVAEAMAGDKPRRTVNLAATEPTGPGYIIPDGDWPL